MNIHSGQAIDRYCKNLIITPIPGVLSVVIKYRAEASDKSWVQLIYWLMSAVLLPLCLV